MGVISGPPSTLIIHQVSTHSPELDASQVSPTREADFRIVPELIRMFTLMHP